MGYSWAYGQDVMVERQPMRIMDMRPVMLAVSYDVDLWGDNVMHDRSHAHMKATVDSRIYKMARMFVHDIWGFDPYFRACRQLPGGYGAHASWKGNRRHQYKGSARV